MPTVIIPPTDVSPNTGSGSEVLSTSPNLITPTISVGATTTAATDLLINPAVKSSGNLLDLQVASSSKFSVSSAGNGTFGGNLTVSGTGGIQLNSVANLTWGGSYGAGIPTIAIPSATSIGFYPTGSTSGKTFELFGTGNATLTGNLTVSGTTGVTASDTILGTSGPSVKSTLSARAPRQGLVFDGTSGANFTEQNTSTPHTVRFVFNSTFDTTGRRYVAWKSASYGMGISSSGEGRKLFVEGSIFALGNTSLVAGKNYDCVFVYNGSTVTFYLNGIADGTTAAITTNNISRILETNQSGSVSGFLIYNRALSASEVVALYEAGAPSGADYNTPAAGSTDLKPSAGTYAYWFGTGSISAATATSFTIAAGASSLAVRNTSGTITVKAGTRYRFTIVASGLNANASFGPQGVSANNTTGNIANGTNTIELTFSGSGSPYFAFADITSTAGGSISISSVQALGLLLAPDAAQAGGGLTWYDTSGNAANITLPASGVSWNVPTSGYVTSGSSLNLSAGGTNQNITLTPSGTGSVVANTASGASIFLQRAGTLIGSVVVAGVNEFALSAAAGKVTNLYANGYGAVGLSILANANVLVGKTIDSSNGRLQLADHTTSAGGIGFGTDIALYRAGGNTLKLELGVSAGVLWFDNGGNGTGGARILGSSGALTITSNGANSLYLQTGGTAALTLSGSDQSATFAGNIVIDKATPTILIKRGANTQDGLIAFATGGNGDFSVGNRGTSDSDLHIYNFGLAADAVTISKNTSAVTFAGSIAINNTVQTAAGVASTHKVTISIGGSTYYLLATNV